MKNKFGTLYLLQFSIPLGNDKHRAEFYLGFTEQDIELRLAEHLSGAGAKITAAAVRLGAEITLIGTIPGTRTDERLLKEQKNHKRLIPIFRGEKTLTFRKQQPRNRRLS